MCERCWINEHTHIDPTFNVSIRQPTMLKIREVEKCSFCGEFTIVGIYVRQDPKTVPYPAEDDDA
jgi:hypothetical protein